MIEIRMPRLSESMTEGKLLMWSVAVGDYVEQGDQIAEIEADKANMDIEAPISGIICSLHGNPGELVGVDSILAEIREEPTHEGPSSPKASVAQIPGDNQSAPHVESPLDRRLRQFETKGDSQS